MDRGTHLKGTRAIGTYFATRIDQHNAHVRELQAEVDEKCGALSRAVRRARIGGNIPAQLSFAILAGLVSQGSGLTFTDLRCGG